ncbi:glutathione S-transferase family protein [Chimaeribacter arupi]|uniref:glutathione S-transferase family protein n=1 Tax=Chimaeribacter arupi TaxID=2060066 RepID=UPI000C7E5264|nr:glutathione S-transferase family protein [Chimaeribacter arupi]PLR46874.1 glutathione S-transferase [Chimaeribacter arupi]
MLTILGRTSSINVRKVLWTCDELALDYRQEMWGHGFQETHQPAFLALNPNAQVPVLRDGEFVLWESNTICRYLAAAGPETTLYPQGARARAEIERWMDWQLGDMNSAWRYLFNARMRNTPAEPDPAQLAESEAGWNQHLTLLANQLAQTGAYVTGGTFTLADIVLGLSVHRWLMTPMSHPALPAIDRYYDLLRERPGFARYATQQWP